MESYKDRMVIAYLVPDEYTEFAMDILIIRDMVLFVGLEEELVIFIKNIRIVEIFKSIFSLYKDSGMKIDLNIFIKQEILNKQG